MRYQELGLVKKRHMKDLVLQRCDDHDCFCVDLQVSAETPMDFDSQLYCHYLVATTESGRTFDRRYVGIVRLCDDEH